VLYRKPKLWVPCGLRDSVLQSKHDSKVAGHMGQDETKELIRRNFWLPKMNKAIIKYIQSCPECQRNKAARHKAYGLLQLLEPAYALWQSIAMDYITDLPLSEGCDWLWVIIDRNTKMAHYIRQRKRTKRPKTSQQYSRDRSGDCRYTGRHHL
jgi:hypothetical protein